MAIATETVEQVWRKGKVVQGADSTAWRKDACDAWMSRNAYGNRESPYGWEIDHITPISQGGSDNLSNLRPLQWQNNAEKQAGRLVCVVTSNGNTNVRR